MLTFKKQSQGTKKRSWNGKKFPRHLLKNEDAGEKDIIAYGHYNRNWNDESPMKRRINTFNKIEKFLYKHIGDDVDVVFSIFLRRCDKNVDRSGLREEFYSNFDSDYGFYLKNNIIKYREYKSNTIKYKRERNIDESVAAKKKIIEVCELSSQRTSPQFLCWDEVTAVFGEHRSESTRNINELLPQRMPVYVIPYDEFENCDEYKAVRLCGTVGCFWLWRDLNNNPVLESRLNILRYSIPKSIYRSVVQYILVTPTKYINAILNNSRLCY